MNIFETTSVYDFDNQEWKDVYKLNGKVVDEETYFDAMQVEASDEESDEECDCEDCCDCDECDNDEEIDESEQEEFRLIGEAIDKIFEVFPCPNCVADAVIDLCMKFKEIGWEDHKAFISELNESN